MLEYLQRGIRLAENEGAEALIFELDTPGGSVDLMNGWSKRSAPAMCR